VANVLRGANQGGEREIKIQPDSTRQGDVRWSRDDLGIPGGIPNEIPDSSEREGWMHVTPTIGSAYKFDTVKFADSSEP
jgi:hypothetical protein